MTLPATRRQQKRNKERERKQRRRQTKRDLAGDKQASGEKETQVADPAAETPRTTQGSSEVLRATPLPKRASEEIADGEARGQSRESAETTVGGVKPKPIKRVAVSVSKPVGQVVMAEAGAEALEAAGVVEMEVTMAVAVAAPSSSATAATVACNNDNKLAVARELQSKEAECVGIKKASTAAEAAETPAEKPAAPATGAIEAAEEAEVKAGVRTRLKQALVKAVTAELRNRAEEEVISKAETTNICTLSEQLFSSKANGGDDGGSHDSGSTYMDDGSVSTCEDSDCSIATDEEEDQQGLSSPSPGDVAVPCNMQTAQHTRYMGNAGGAYYPMQGSPMQHQQQGILPWVNEGYGAGACQTPMQYVPQQHMSMSYGKHVDMARPMPVQPTMQYQQTSGGAYLQNIGGTYYPVATQPMKKSECVYDQNYVGTCSTLTPSYTQPPAMGCGGNITGSCPLPAPSYMQPTQEFESCGNVSGVSTSSVVPPAEKYPRTFSYGGRTYPYWMSDLGHPLSTPS